MRLWHQKLIPFLPKNQLQGQHREVSAIRGLGFDKNHSIINYIYNYGELAPIKLYRYHFLVMEEMKKRNPDINIDIRWFDKTYRGKRSPAFDFCVFNQYDDSVIIFNNHHKDEYLLENYLNLLLKGKNLSPNGHNVDYFYQVMLKLKRLHSEYKLKISNEDKVIYDYLYDKLFIKNDWCIR